MNEHNTEHDELIGDLQAIGRRLEGETFPGTAWKPKRKSRFKSIIAAASVAAAVLLAVALSGHLDKEPNKEIRKQAANKTNHKIENKPPVPVAPQTAAVASFRPTEKVRDLQVSVMSFLSSTKKAIEQIPLKMPSLDFTGKDKTEKESSEDKENIRGNSCTGGRLRRFA